MGKECLFRQPPSLPFVFGENPAVSDPNSNHALKGFTALDFLVVQDIFLTETAELADVILPSGSFAEKMGTFTSSERRVQLVRPAVATPGQAREDLEIFQEIDRRFKKLPPKRVAAPEVFDELASLWPAMSGMNYGRLEGEGLQWPCPDQDHPGTPFLFGETFARPESSKAVFTVVPHLLSSELPDADYTPTCSPPAENCSITPLAP